MPEIITSNLLIEHHLVEMFGQRKRIIRSDVFTITLSLPIEITLIRENYYQPVDLMQIIGIEACPNDLALVDSRAAHI